MSRSGFVIARSVDSCALRCCVFVFFFNDTATTEIYTLSLHDALPIYGGAEGALQLRALFGSVRQHDELFFAECHAVVDPPLAFGNPLEQPLGGDQGFQVAPFGAGLR